MQSNLRNSPNDEVSESCIFQLSLMSNFFIKCYNYMAPEVGFDKYLQVIKTSQSA